MAQQKQIRHGRFLAKRLRQLESHLKTENPVLLEVLPTYYKLDRMLYRMGLLDRDASLATRISWWPLISVLGTFSSGKSTFINSFLGESLQQTGNQAVDDKFTVVCYRASAEGANHTLPGTALDADPRFPFYRMSREIELVAEGEGKRIESYLQLKTTSREVVRGKIVIDSPGFDADDQRRSTLRITDHIIDLSDLVLVFFDARHPEPGAMQDTLAHLVAKTVRRTDASKFLYILNQIDTTAKEDNPEEVVGAWQRAVSQAGLTTGRFYCIYNEKAAVPIDDPALRNRFKTKKDADLAAIQRRMNEVEIQRSYRIVGVLETVISEVEGEIVPRLAEAIAKWRRGVVLADLVGLLAAGAAAAAAALRLDWPLPEGMSRFDWLQLHQTDITFGAAVAAVIALSYHFTVRDWIAKRVARKLPEVVGQVELALRQAFLKNTRFFSSVLRTNPIGGSPRAIRRMLDLREVAAGHVQRLNDCYADPSGKQPGRQEPVLGIPANPETPLPTAGDSASEQIEVKG